MIVGNLNLKSIAKHTAAAMILLGTVQLIDKYTNFFKHKRSNSFNGTPMSLKEFKQEFK